MIVKCFVYECIESCDAYVYIVLVIVPSFLQVMDPDCDVDMRLHAASPAIHLHSQGIPLYSLNYRYLTRKKKNQMVIWPLTNSVEQALALELKKLFNI